MPHTKSSLCSLPPELIEEIIIASTLLGDTHAAAALARTSRHFRALVYRQFHNHLWREMFLVVFDDPRPALKVRNLGKVPHPSSKGKGKDNSRLCVDDYPWEDEYKRRIWTESFILRRTRAPLDSPPSRDTPIELPSTNAELYAVLRTLLHVISTARPLPYDALACTESPCHPCGPPHPHPIFAPLFVAAHTRPALVPESRNITWLARVLAHGLPRAFMARLTVFDENDRIDAQKWPVEWDGLLAKLVAQIGLTTPITTGGGSSGCTACPAEQPPHSVLFVPDTTMAVDDNGAVSGTSTGEEQVQGEDADERGTRICQNWHPDEHDLSSEDDDDDDPDFEPHSGESASESESEIDGDEVLGTTATQETSAQDGVRRLARIRVYNMAYPHPSRAYGPFLPLRKMSRAPSPSSSNPDPYFTDPGEDGDDEDMVGSSLTTRYC
jgi:hypothetical protein